MILGCTVKFIDSDETLRNILCCSHDMNAVLRETILKQALLRSNLDRLPQKRHALWLKLMKVDTKTAKQDFVKHKQRAV